MKRRTKNFIEDTLIVIGVLFILYLIYFFAFSDKSENSLEVVQQNAKVEVEQKQQIEPQEDGFFTQLYEEIKEKFFQNKGEDKPNIVEEKAKEEKVTKEVYLSQRAEIISKQEERARERKEDEQSFEVIKHDEPKADEVKQEVKQEVKSEDIATDEPKKEEAIQEIQTQTKVLEDVKTDENSGEDHAELTNIDNLFSDFEKKLYKNIDKNFDKTMFKRGEFVNVRVTILKDGRYEQLTFLNGNIDYFNKIKSQIEQLFPLKIDESLRSNFPRYYRMKIDF